jgi:hypothetical protein
MEISADLFSACPVYNRQTPDVYHAHKNELCLHILETCPDNVLIDAATRPMSFPAAGLRLQFSLANDSMRQQEI